MTRWNLSIPEQTDRTVRTFLARTGGTKGSLSRFVDEAVRRIKDRNAQQAHSRSDQRGSGQRTCRSCLIPLS